MPKPPAATLSVHVEGLTVTLTPTYGPLKLDAWVHCIGVRADGAIIAWESAPAPESGGTVSFTMPPLTVSGYCDISTYRNFKQTILASATFEIG